MRKKRKCAFCGKEFTCNSGSQKYCSEHCAEAAKAQRKKKRQDFIKAVEPAIDIASQEYLTFSKAAILMGCTRQYVYKLVNEGKLTASRISSRMAFIRRATSNRCWLVILTIECCLDVIQTKQAKSHPLHHLPCHQRNAITRVSVSYTHLTLPTILLV